MTKQIMPVLDTDTLVKTVGDKQVKSARDSMDEQKTFLDTIKITSTLSDHFNEQDSKQTPVGDFYFQDQTLGKEIEVIIPYYVNKVVAIEDKTWNFFGSILFDYREEEWKNSPKYKEFMKKIQDSGKELVVDVGIDFMCYLPKLDSCGSLFCKRTTLSGGNQIILSIRKHQTQHFILNTYKNKPEQKFFSLGNTPLQQVSNYLPKPELQKYLSKFISIGREEEKTKNVQKGR